MIINIPPGVVPGQYIQVQLPNGSQAQVQVPEGVPPGGQFLMKVPKKEAVGGSHENRTLFEQYRTPIQDHQPGESINPSPVLHSTGDPIRITRDTDCGLWYKCVCCPCYLPCCLCCLTKQVVFIYTGEVGIVEKFDKFQRIATPGELLLESPLGSCCSCLNEKVAKRLSMRIRELPVTSRTKTKDNVFLEITVVIMFRILNEEEERVYNAAYRLTDIRAQIGDYVEDVIRSRVAGLELDQVFLSTHEIATTLLEQIADKLNEFGYTIVSTLITNIEPDISVRRAMNEVNTQRRLKAAQVFNAEAEKAVDINRAQADAECKYLQGVGLAKMRTAIIDGLADSIDTLQSSSLISHNNLQDSSSYSVDDTTSLLLITQYMDALEQLGQAKSNQNAQATIHLPVGFDAIRILRSRLKSFMTALSF